MVWLTILIVIVIVFGFVGFFGAPYVPSQRKYVRRAFENLYPLGSRDLLVDVGSGDGVVLRIAASYGARAVGYEINPVLAVVSWVLSRRYEGISTKLANFWMVSLPAETTVVYAFSVSRDGERLKKMLQGEANRLKRPLKLICYGSPLSGVKPDKTLQAYTLYTFRPA